MWYLYYIHNTYIYIIYIYTYIIYIYIYYIHILYTKCPCSSLSSFDKNSGARSVPWWRRNSKSTAWHFQLRGGEIIKGRTHIVTESWWLNGEWVKWPWWMGEMNGKIIVIAMFEIVVNRQNSLSFVFFPGFWLSLEDFCSAFWHLCFLFDGSKAQKTAPKGGWTSSQQKWSMNIHESPHGDHQR